jgi:hypothetical protein
MAERRRTVQLHVFVSEEEAALVKEKMLGAGTKNFSSYARKMLTDGQVVRRDFSGLKALAKELSGLARSINQIALRANETRSIHERDVRDLQAYYHEVRRAVTGRLAEMAEE